MSTTAQITNAGLNLLRDYLTGAKAPATIPVYIALGTGCGALAATITNGTIGITSVTLAAPGLPAIIPNGTSLTLCQDGTTQVITASGAGNTAGATSVTVTSFTAAATFTSGVSALIITPAATDTALQVETYRQQLTSATNGASAGESDITLYLAPQNGQVVIAEIGWFAGPTVSGTAASGTLIARAPYGHNHTFLESIQAVLDSTI